MPGYLGDFRIATTIRDLFNTTAVAGESIVLATDGTVSVYKDLGLTQSTTGVTFGETFDSLTGVNSVVIDTSADGTFYSAGSDFFVVLSGATIDGKAINAILFSFSLEARSALMAVTAGRRLVVDTAGLGDANMVKAGPTGSGTAQTARDLGASVLLSSGTGTGQLDFTSGVVKANLAQILGTAITGTAAQLAAAFTKWFNVASPTGTVNSIPDAVAGAASGIALVGSNVGAATSVSGAVGSVAAAVTVGTNNDKTGYSLSSAAVQAIWDALTSALTTVGSIGKLLVDNLNATISSRLASASYTAPLDAAGTRTAVGLASANLDTQLSTIDDFLDTEVAAILAAVTTILAAVDTEVLAIKVVTDKLGTSVELDGAVYRFTTNALEQAPSGGGGGGASVSDIFTANPADYDAANNFAQAVMWMRSMAAGKFVVNTGANTLTLYDLDGTTVLRTFDLTPSGGPYTTRVPQ